MLRGLVVASILTLAPALALAQAPPGCDKITITGHPEYPPIAWRDGDAIVGPGPDVVRDIAGELGIPTQSVFMGPWVDAQQAAHDGKADIIVGIYKNEDRASYLDFIEPPFAQDPVAVFVDADRPFAFKSRDDLIGKRGVTNLGESYGPDLDKFINDKLTMTRTLGIELAFDMLLRGDADYLIAGRYAGLYQSARSNLQDEIVDLDPDLTDAGLFIAFSRKSPCAGLASQFGEKLAAMLKDGRVAALISESTKAWTR